MHNEACNINLPIVLSPVVKTGISLEGQEKLNWKDRGLAEVCQLQREERRAACTWFESLSLNTSTGAKVWVRFGVKMDPGVLVMD